MITRIRLVTSVLTFALLAGGLTACTTLWFLPACDGTGQRAEALRSHPLLGAAPDGAEPAGEDWGCWEDSGEAWVYAERTHTFSGSRREVLAFYRSAAEAEGWALSADSHPSGVCYTRGEGGDSLLFVVGFDPAGNTRADYGVEVSATADGSDVAC